MIPFDRIYQGIWERLTDWFRVPDRPPDPPMARPDEESDSFQPAEGFMRYMKFWFWMIVAIKDVGILAAYIAIFVGLASEDLWWVAVLLFPLVVTLMLVPGVLCYIAIHLRFDTTWYVMTDRSLRVRRGIWVIHETTITFENVQNVMVQQGPVQRHFGISTLIVETAGGAQVTKEGQRLGVANRGIIEGITDAKRLRDRILVRLRATESTGLGDEKADRRGAGWSAAHLEALRAVRDEVVALKRG